MPIKSSPIPVLKHVFEVVLTKTSHFCVVACVDYPKCKDMITIFGDRN
jgi:hypothetical protein